MTDVKPIAPLGRPVDAVVRPPGSKSLTNRALVVAALAEGGVSRLGDPLESDDTRIMRAGLRALGVAVEDNDDPWLVLGSGGRLENPEGVIDAGASGTAARFLTAAALLAPGPVTIDGTARMRRRPIGPLVDALTVLGGRVTSAGGYPPVTVAGGRVRGGEVEVDMSLSSQFASAVLMIAPLAETGTRVRLVGESKVSLPYLAGTVEVMEAFGAGVRRDGGVFDVAPTGYRRTHYDVEADASAAAYLLVAAAITGGRVAIAGIPGGSSQPDLALVGVLESMGCRVTHQEGRIVLEGPERLDPVDVDMTGAPDAALALAVATVFATGSSRIRGLGTLRLKETDRLTALEKELTRIGSAVRVEGDSLVIHPGPVRPARVETYDDHRMAMAFAVAGLRVPGIEIIDPDCVSKTWPGFFQVLESL